MIGDKPKLRATIGKLEQVIRRDPARRGLISREGELGVLCFEHLYHSAIDLARGARVAIVTGFFVPQADPPAAETDGPLGAVCLAELLMAMGIETRLVTDSLCANAVRIAADAAGIGDGAVCVCDDPSDDWIDAFVRQQFSEELSHLIAVERVGPSHTLESLVRQQRPNEPPIEAFEAKVAVHSQDHCHNMRGIIIDEYSGRLHRLFEFVASEYPQVRTIGIGDGGNEIGMGSIPWEELELRLMGDHSASIPCRIGTDWTIIAGTSNWGAYALAAATALIRNQSHLLRDWPVERHEQILSEMVIHGPAVDGVTRCAEPTVDGLPFLTYIQAWEGLLRVCQEATAFEQETTEGTENQQ